jgi:hypothetical protein
MLFRKKQWQKLAFNKSSGKTYFFYKIIKKFLILLFKKSVFKFCEKDPQTKN